MFRSPVILTILAMKIHCCMLPVEKARLQKSTPLQSNFMKFTGLKQHKKMNSLPYKYASSVYSYECQ